MFYSIENGLLIATVSRPDAEMNSAFSRTIAASASDRGDFGYLRRERLALLPICNCLFHGQDSFCTEVTNA